LKENSPVPIKLPIKSIKLTITIKTKVTIGKDCCKTATILLAATTNKAIENATIAFMFFLGLLFSCPNIIVFSKIANTIVKTSKKGRSISKKPKSFKKLTAISNGEGINLKRGIKYIRLLSNFFDVEPPIYLNKNPKNFLKETSRKLQEETDKIN